VLSFSIGAPQSVLPTSQWPVAPPLGHHVRPLPIRLAQVTRQIDNVGVHLNREQVQIGGTGPDLLDEVFAEAGQGRRGQVIGVHLVNHLRDVVDCVPDLWILALEIQFIANRPDDQRRMILVFQDLCLDAFELTGNRGLIVVVEAVAFAAQIQTHRDVQAILEGAVEHLLAGVTPVLRPPRAEGVATVFGELLLGTEFQARAFDVEGFLVHVQLVAIVCLADCHLHGPVGLPGFVGAAWPRTDPGQAGCQGQR
jgi:hypothetical protein